jgi:hypothetical protein
VIVALRRSGFDQVGGVMPPAAPPSGPSDDELLAALIEASGAVPEALRSSVHGLGVLLERAFDAGAAPVSDLEAGCGSPSPRDLLRPGVGICSVSDVQECACVCTRCCSAHGAWRALSVPAGTVLPVADQALWRGHIDAR